MNFRGHIAYPGAAEAVTVGNTELQRLAKSSVLKSVLKIHMTVML